VQPDLNEPSRRRVREAAARLRLVGAGLLGLAILTFWVLRGAGVW